MVPSRLHILLTAQVLVVAVPEGDGGDGRLVDGAGAVGEAVVTLRCDLGDLQVKVGGLGHSHD